jgi:hypothetical protein
MYPDDPEIEAGRRADAALFIGDVFNFRLWERVTAAVRELRRGKNDGEPVN